MDIRTLDRSDLHELLELYQHLHTSDDPLPASKQIEATWSEIMANKGIRYFGGFVQGKLISCCSICIIPNLTRGCRPYGVIENVVTRRDHRKRGYGTAVLHAALEYAWQLECYKVMLLSGRSNSETRRFYESAGFDPNAKQAFIAKPVQPVIER